MWRLYPARITTRCPDYHRSFWFRIGVRDMRNESVSLVSRRYSLNLAKSSFFGGRGFTKVPQSGQVFIGGGSSGPTEIQSPSMCPGFHLGGGTLDQLKSKVSPSSHVLIWEGGTLDQVKPKVPTSLTIFNGVGVGGVGLLWTPHSSNTSVGITQGLLNQKF